jgi:ElaA protein
MNNAQQKATKFPDLQWRWYALEDMKPGRLYDMLALREAIFVVEQTCVYQELDGLDKTAGHLLALKNDMVVACLRVLPPDENEQRIRIGRVAVSSGCRKRGVARQMMQAAIDKTRQDYPSCGIFLDAQTYLKAFYESMGFQVCGGEFLEDGIPHIPMQM